MSRCYSLFLLLLSLCFSRPAMAQMGYYDGCNSTNHYVLRVAGDVVMAFRFVPTDTCDYVIDTEGRRIGTVRGIFVGETEVTQQQWQAVMGATSFPIEGDSLPVVGVELEAIQLFIHRLDSMQHLPLRLPSLQEWCLAAQGGEPYAYPGDRRAWPVAWCKANSNGNLHAVAQRVPNALGIYDMAGNVAEWTENLVAVPDAADSAAAKCYIPVGGSYEDAAEQCRIPLQVSPCKREALQEPLSASAATLLGFDEKTEPTHRNTLGFRLVFYEHFYKEIPLSPPATAQP